MAYGTKYRFTFDSEQGTPFQILIKKDGYSGSVLDRALGGSPVLRRDRSDAICGTSLEIPAECAVDGEFEEFKTSVPFTFLVELYGGDSFGTLIWTGYVTPELMSAPDIATPYDVQISCTDGLGELKYTNFPARGGNTLQNHLEYLLGLANLGLSIEMVNDIYHGSYSASQLLTSMRVNLDFLEDKSCYDVLQYILTTLHATITQHAGAWLIFRETGAAIVHRAGSQPFIATSSGRVVTVDSFGSMRTHSDGWWPVGHMTHQNEPARKRIVLTSENHYVGNILSDNVWQAVSGGVNSGDYWTLAAAGDGMKQPYIFGYSIAKKLLLSIKVRNVGAGSDTGKLSVKVKAVGTSYSGARTYYLANGTYSRRNAQTNFTWSTDEVDSVIDVQAPSAEDTDEDYVTIGIVLPIYRNSARDYFYCSSLEVTISNQSGTYEQRVYGVSLSKYERFSGFRKVAELGNGARGDNPDVDLLFAAMAGGNLYNGVEELMYGVPVDATSYEPISSWYSSKFDAGMDFLSLMARDYALSIAAARTRLRGTLNVPVGRARIPVCFTDDHDSVSYFIDTLSWSLFADELEVEMLSQPTASITVSEETLEEAASTNDTNHAQGESTSGGGGGGGGTGTVTSVGLTMPTAFSVTGSPVTGAGTIAVALKSGYVILETGAWTSVQQVAHDHNNKSLLDGITLTKINHWDLAYNHEHTHNNKALLDTITQARMEAWDAGGSGGGSVISISDLQQDGTKVATITINRTDYAIRVPGDTVDVSIGGTAAAPTLRVDLGSGAYDYVAIPIASAAQSGIVSTGDQSFAGGKTFERIYLGTSRSSGAYIEWDAILGAFKIVGDVYATGEVAAGE